ncbi:ATP-dependent RNA helicase [Idiomarina tyrosinivorans]|uniref:RNA helicase n=2 Tax=Idiomarina tyrosinivorans TaxID=1445662 RepID=A0A432ZJW0_9GAMM|nr:ATP-dependent RNA helicase [Idiomarina tyrosinivorans]
MSEFRSEQSFADMALPSAVLNQLEALQFTQPTPIQQQAIPALLAGANVLGEAQTGTGKTAAFGLPALAQVDANLKATQVLVVTPTRELAIQVAEAIDSFAKQQRGVSVTTVYGGSAFGPQIKALRSGTTVVVGTPGRLIDLLNKGVLKLDALRMAVLDEADEMLNMGFIEDIETLLRSVPEQAQRALFSATMPTAIRKLAKTYLTDPVNIRIEPVEKAKRNITQRAWQVQGMTKMTALARVLEITTYQRALIFVRTRQDTMDVAEQLQRKGFKAAPLSGDLNQSQREQTVSQLRSGHIEILVATDVVARGLDVPEITHVINYDLPGDTESYVHRIGRTGRAGREGEAILFYRPRERHLLKHYERATNGVIEAMTMPAAQQLNEHRQDLLLQRIQQTLATDVSDVQGLLQSWLEKHELSAEQIAMALLQQENTRQPMFMAEEKVIRAPKIERQGQSKKGREERRRAGPRRGADVDFDTYKIQVGKTHGARPSDIVGAIANEASLDSRYIGQIQLFDSHSLVELPKGMPKDVMHVLTKARVRQQPMAIEVTDAKVARPPRKEHRGGGAPERKRSSRSASGNGSKRGAARRFS